MARAFQVTFDAADPQGLARFWIEVLGYKEEDPPGGSATWREWATDAGLPKERWNDYASAVHPEGAGSRLFFQRVPESKAAKNRVHLDVNVAARGTTPSETRRLVDAEADRLRTLGATLVQSFDEDGQYWIFMRDPEGNEFCLQ